MRLQLLIQRHSLPPVTIIHTTGSGPASHTKSRSATIADLLADVNDLVPLESADGEWGLEDYAVEVASTADQNLTYECLHFQTLYSVLREDDEVVIRALSNEDLRVRRLGGRHQITGDGRHLIDGVAFGKQWLKQTQRPGIVIPPRKKRKILFDEDVGVAGEEDAKRTLPSPAEGGDRMDALVLFQGCEEDEDDENDHDYVDEADADADGPGLQLTVREDFDDADADSEDEFELNGEDEGENLSSELENLLEDAAEIEQAANMAIAMQVLDGKLKRKRNTGDDGEEYENEVFEGFSTPIRSSSAGLNRMSGAREDGRTNLEDDEGESRNNMTRKNADRRAEKRAGNALEDDEEDSEDSDTTRSSDISSSDSEADSTMEDTAMQQAKKRALSLIRDGDVDHNTSSSSDSEEDESDDDITSSSESESDSVKPTSSDSETSESESESEPESEIEERNTNRPSESKTASSTAALQTKGAKGKPAKSSVGVPFQGTNRTHYNNDRAKRRKRLNQLKKQGLLPENAAFEDLAKYESTQQQKMEEEQEQEHAAEQRADRQVEEVAAKAAVNEVEEENVKPSKRAESAVSNDAPVEPTSAGLEIPETSQIDPVVPESAPKRARLDVASSRRLVFGSLGLRAPKTAEEAQALREKLSQTSRQQNHQKSNYDISALEPSQRALVAEKNNDSWKNKLIVAAVECEEPGICLPPPPFPFEQGWAKPAKNKRKLRDQSQYYQSRNGWPHEKDDGAVAPEVASLNYDVKPYAPSDHALLTVDGNAEDVPVRDSFDGLPELNQAQILPGAIIVYKELHVDASTNYQPEVSPYRVAEVSEVDEDGTVHVQLTKGSMAADSQGKIYPQTGQRVHGKFELANEDPHEVDDGLREISFSNMISAKLLKASVVEDPNSSHIISPRGGEAPMLSTEDQFAVIPESARQTVEAQAADKPDATAQTIDTPRKQEINEMIKEAGFDSALDEELLEPIPNAAADNAKDAPSPVEESTQSQGQYPHRFRLRSPRVNASSSDLKTSSDVDTNANPNDGPGDADPSRSSKLPPTSSPYISTQETVEYPHISQMDINSSDPPRTTNSSSHQDAQKVSLTPALDLSSTTFEQGNVIKEDLDSKKNELDAEHLIDENPSRSEDVPVSLESEVPESQDQQASIPSQSTEAEDEGVADGSSFLGRFGYDGQDSSYHDSGSDDDDSDLPSQSKLTSSQRHHRRTRSLSRRVSPPAPTRKSLRNTTKKKLRSPTPPSSPDLSAPSETAIKLSQSQRGPRLSQIPAGSPIVDLTFSSDAPSPVKDTDDNSDSTGGQKKTKSEVGSMSRSTSARAGKRDSGIGVRRLLTSKKARGYY
ncbi:uncharacterized protein Z519_12624 [Cladophialophora bantiana CBS 173.52]|uniref:Uncharacterized protein n=1 Tax=Cladophialophora bantiana (strain ATCC 10958 / CBS 173.52 / CDC B-1940 / NIH 8579) TaxID=1442370 RepID=A0A0D2H0N1_CLAB1|nr:uncharacterized protein Z519_12624 [Cladophialophora bantiana CBS 173.52]KIW86838.1 hypothetical protein Z519_12624 [Cladophialophora bantiana CBS 173.52]